MTQELLAAAARVSIASVHRAESNAPLAGTTLHRICDALDIPIEEATGAPLAPRPETITEVRVAADLTNWIWDCSSHTPLASERYDNAQHMAVLTLLHEMFDIVMRPPGAAVPQAVQEAIDACHDAGLRIFVGRSPAADARPGWIAIQEQAVTATPAGWVGAQSA